jgi:ABC-2 type transport system ATP-binding protein
MRNGAGKTTAMRAVFGLTALDSGTVRWNGALVTQSGRRRFGYLPEERGLYPGMRAAEQLEYLGRLHGLSPAVAAAAAAGWLERLGVGDRAGTKVESLSLGNQQRVQLASALVHNPDLLILDEPLSGLDPAGIDAVGEILASQARVIPALLSNRADIERVGVAGQLSAPVRAAVLADGPATGTRVELVAEPSRQAAAADLRSGRIGLAIVDGRQVVVAKAAAGTSASSLLPQAVARTVGPGAALQAAGLTPAQAAAIAGARALPVTSLEPGGPGTTQRNATFVGLLLLVFMLTQYNAWTLTGVLEEKSSRIV